MRLFCIIAVVAIAMALTACQTPAPIVQTKTVVLSPPDSLLISADVAPPPDKTTYASAACETREKMLYDMNIDQMNNLFLVNLRLSNLRSWKIQQESVQNPPAAESK